MNEISYDTNIFWLPEPGRMDACIVTTNGMVKKDGRAVMGAGIAKYCRDHFGVDRMLGQCLQKGGNHVYSLGLHSTPEWPGGKARFRIFSFPTKDDWRDDAKTDLIRQSCREMMDHADELDLENIYMPCPGCSNGRLDYWKDVRSILEQELDDRFIVCIPKAIMDKMPIPGLPVQ